MRSDGRDRLHEYVAALDRRRARPADELEQELAPLRALGPRDKGEWVASVCRSAWAILRSRSDGERIIRSQEPPAADFHQLWAELARRRRVR